MRHKDKIDKFSVFVVPGDGPALLGMPDIEVLDLLKIMYEVMGDPNKSRMLNFQSIQAFNNPSCKANKVKEIKADNVDVNDANSNIILGTASTEQQIKQHIRHYQTNHIMYLLIF